MDSKIVAFGLVALLLIGFVFAAATPPVASAVTPITTSIVYYLKTINSNLVGPPVSSSAVSTAVATKSINFSGEFDLGGKESFCVYDIPQKSLLNYISGDEFSYLGGKIYLIGENSGSLGINYLHKLNGDFYGGVVDESICPSLISTDKKDSLVPSVGISVSDDLWDTGSQIKANLFDGGEVIYLSDGSNVSQIGDSKNFLKIGSKGKLNYTTSKTKCLYALDLDIDTTSVNELIVKGISTSGC